MKKLKSRLTTYVCEARITFSFQAKETLEGQALWNACEKNFDRAIISGDYEVNPNDINVVKKIIHTSPEERKAEDEIWKAILKR